MNENTELESLDGLTSEVRDVRAALADLTAALDEVASWSKTLPDRWAGTEGSTAGLDTAVRAIAEAAANLKLPQAVIEQLAVLEQEANRARVLGEAAADAGATGDFTGFAAEVSGDGAEADANHVQYGPAVELAVRQAYSALVHRAGKDGATPRWVSLAKLRGELEHAAVEAGRLPYSREAVDAALEELALQPGIHVQAEANQQALTDEDHAAAVRFGGSTRHLLMIESAERTTSARRAPRA
ncbi:hypothetical protein ABZS29_38445 [Kribbella sp. NPDC005582]|uniref:hypothetical protein n=1 Tax=Kribbella sp. NPDC005582 TaxID=3156893 RepID=UPI0033B72D10